MAPTTLEIWRLPLWAGRCATFMKAADSYLAAGLPGLCKASWFVANVLARRGPLGARGGQELAAERIMRDVERDR